MSTYKDRIGTAHSLLDSIERGAEEEINMLRAREQALTDALEEAANFIRGSSIDFNTRGYGSHSIECLEKVNEIEQVLNPQPGEAG